MTKKTFKKPRLNALSVDVEDYFHVEAFAAHISQKDWNNFSPRVENNTIKVLDLFARYDVHGTFYILGWVAERFPHLIRRIAAAGHEIGCHGFSHQLIGRQTSEQFRLDIRKSRDLLTNETQRDVTCYRAPSFSIGQQTQWALEVLAEESFKIDSSIFPVKHDLYGMPDAPRFPYWHTTCNGCPLYEFPPSTIKLKSMNLGVGGGGYLRLFPYIFTRWAIKKINEKDSMPAMVYFHPWELDPDQPRIPARFRSRFRHYTHLSVMEKKLKLLLQNFHFDTVTHVCETLDSYRSSIHSSF